MYFVYILRSCNFPDQLYIGCTNNLKNRIKQHNNGNSLHTKKYLPWNIDFYIAFKNQELAFNFESYLKTPNGKQLLKKHFIKKVDSACTT
jgi:putative endonuclease